MKKLDVVGQSKAAYDQWCDQWREHAKEHGKLAPHKPLHDFLNSGVGKSLLLVANGYSFEKNIESIKKNRSKFDIMACDKTLKHLIKNGIKPDFCLVCDANVSYEKYLQPVEDQLENTVLFMNVCANPKWSRNGNWKDMYFFCNMDAIKSENEFGPLSKCEHMIPAATNVSNAMVVFVTQSTNNQRMNYFGYDKINLIGFDYCWLYGGKYYSFDEDGEGKKYYMKHIYCWTTGGDPAYTSHNLHFSAQWLSNYVQTFNLPIVQCTKDTIMKLKYNGQLDEHIAYRYQPEDQKIVRSQMFKREKLLREMKAIEHRISKIGQDHYRNFLATV